MDLIKLKAQCVLVVDDDQDILDLFFYTYPDSHVVILTAKSFDEALSLMSKHSVDLVISEAKIDGINCLKLLKEVTSSESLIPFIIMTAIRDKSLIQDYLNEGARCFHYKPFNYDEVLETTRKYLEIKAHNEWRRGLTGESNENEGLEKLTGEL